MSFIVNPGIVQPPLTAGAVAYGTGTSVLMTPAGSAGQALLSNGAGIPTWSTTVPSTTSLAGGSAGVVPYQSAANTTAFTTVGTAGQVLQSNATGAPTWTTDIAGNAANVTGVVAIANGGTGATSAANARTNLVAQETLVSGTNIKTVGGQSLLGSGNISVGSGTVTSVSGTGTVQGITLSGTVTSSGNLTLGGSLSAINLASQVTGTLGVGNGGTGVTTGPMGVLVSSGNISNATVLTVSIPSGYQTVLVILNRLTANNYTQPLSAGLRLGIGGTVITTSTYNFGLSGNNANGTGNYTTSYSFSQGGQSTMIAFRGAPFNTGQLGDPMIPNAGFTNIFASAMIYIYSNATASSTRHPTYYATYAKGGQHTFVTGGNQTTNGGNVITSLEFTFSGSGGSGGFGVDGVYAVYGLRT